MIQALAVLASAPIYAEYYDAKLAALGRIVTCLPAFLDSVHPTGQVPKEIQEIGQAAEDLIIHKLLRVNNLRFSTLQDEELTGLELSFAHYDSNERITVLGDFIGDDKESAFFRLFGLCQEEIDAYPETQLGYFVLRCNGDSFSAAMLLATGEDGWCDDAFRTPDWLLAKLIVAAKKVLA
ncbi:MAG TPA: hypothetical protein VLA88_06450 [Candidatus Saccharimonadales bacterium]|nr:hypothetical protein [Candidatus Saccharimonadales bacterium]